MAPPPPRSIFRICTLCEATCGLRIDVEGDRVRKIVGDDADPFSRGFLCPKAIGMKALQEDPDRLNTPRIREGGTFREASWEEAFDVALRGLVALREQHGADAIATYLGNPSAHSLHAMVYGPVLQRALGTRQRYSASSLDQLPKMVSAGLMFGAGLTIPVPDVDRTRLLLVVGANPLVSNGSLMTAPDMPGRLRALRARGGRLIVVDPRRTETAEVADEHLFIRPGTDAAFLLSLAHVLVEERLVRLGRAEGLVRGLDAAKRAVQAFSPGTTAAFTGIPAETVQRLARALVAEAPAACYGRIGTTCQEFGTIASWAVDLVNVLSGNLDVPGGAMFTKPAANRAGGKVATGRGRGVKLGRTRSTVKGLPESFGELPVAALADEILEGPVHGLVTLAGNPALSAPGAERLDRALSGLSFMVSVDFYLNETTRHAHVILPPPPPLERDTYDLALYQLAVRNVAKYSAAALPKADDRPDEWEILLTLAKGLMGMRDLPLAAMDQQVLALILDGEIGEGSRFADLTAAEALEKLGDAPGPARVLDAFLRTGPYGDGFGRVPGGLSLDHLRQHPHGLDLGPLEPMLPEVLKTSDGQIDLAPEPILEDLPRLEARLGGPAPALVLIGRRHLRSNNSWMHNLHPLVKGPARCTLLVSPADAQARGLVDGGRAEVKSRVGRVVADVEVTDAMMPGVVSLPHGWGHDLAPEGSLHTARAHAGVNVNRLSDETLVDQPSGNAAFNGVPVEIARVDAAE
jgi:anaerobic selenocysteine-containing dehydrogenase